MDKWVFILMMLGQDHETGVIDWKDSVKMGNLSFEVCIEAVVDTVVIFGHAKLRHKVYCRKQIEEDLIWIAEKKRENDESRKSNNW